MLPNIPATIKLLCIVVVVKVPESQQQVCDSGWFGEKCRFQCHCLLSPTCDADGNCPDNGKCATGYFGPACQYVDLARKATAGTVSYATDGDEDTCNTNSNDRVVLVSWVDGITFTWFRLHVNKPGNLNNFKVKLNEKIDCPNEKKFAVSATSVDVSCDVHFSVLAVEVIGAVAPDVCSIYISGGRNVALKQDTNQSSVYRNSALSQSSNAVDGNTDNVYQNGSCIHTLDEKAAPKWFLYFDRPYSIHEIIIYNRIYLEYQAQGIVLTTYNAQGNPTFSYTERRNHTLNQFITKLPSLYPITMINITKAIADLYGYHYLVFCELQAFGEAVCPDGYYGISCDKRCACQGREVCFTVTGACSPGCSLGTFGANCAFRCNPKCKHMACQMREGACLSCHDGFTGQYCAKGCKTGTYGPGCTLKCSKNCDDGCDRNDGYCHCRHPFVGPTCSECPPPFYGDNCTTTCSSKCALSRCKFDNGECIWCRGSRRGPYCGECPPKYYGSLCFKRCSRFCHNETCDSDTGACSPCTDNYSGRNCNEAPMSIPWLYLLIAVAVSAVISLVFMLLYIRSTSKADDIDSVSDFSPASEISRDSS